MEPLEMIGAIAEAGVEAGAGVVEGGVEAGAGIIGAGAEAGAGVVEGGADAGAELVGASAEALGAGAELPPNPLEDLDADGVPFEDSEEVVPEQEKFPGEEFEDNTKNESENTGDKNEFDPKTESPENSEDSGIPKSDWETLGVSENATPEEIQDTYRRLAKETHPDVSGNAGDAEKFRDINEAYERIRSGEGRTKEQAADTEKAYQERVKTAQENSKRYTDADTAKKEAGAREYNRTNQSGPGQNWARNEQPRDDARRNTENRARQGFDERAREGRQETRNRRERGPKTSDSKNEREKTEREKQHEEEVAGLKEELKKLYEKQSEQKKEEKVDFTKCPHCGAQRPVLGNICRACGLEMPSKPITGSGYFEAQDKRNMELLGEQPYPEKGFFKKLKWYTRRVVMSIADDFRT